MVSGQSERVIHLLWFLFCEQRRDAAEHCASMVINQQQRNRTTSTLMIRGDGFEVE